MVERISQAVVPVRVRNAEAGFKGLQTEVLDWLGEKAGRSLPDAMLQGETDSFDCLGRRGSRRSL